MSDVFDDDAITAALDEVHAGWLMDDADEFCQANAIRHVVAAAVAAERARVDMKALCEAALKAEFAFPPLPPGLVRHAKLGDLHDRLAMHQYGLRVAEAMLKAAATAPTTAPVGGEG